MHRCVWGQAQAFRWPSCSAISASNAGCIAVSLHGLPASLGTTLHHRYTASDLLVLEGVGHYYASELGRVVQALFFMGAQVKAGQGHRLSRSIRRSAAQFIREPSIMLLLMHDLRINLFADRPTIIFALFHAARCCPFFCLLLASACSPSEP